jgi:hypothetical protein
MQVVRVPKSRSARGERSAGMLNRALLARKCRTDMGSRDAMSRKFRCRLRTRDDDVFSSLIAIVS